MHGGVSSPLEMIMKRIALAALAALAAAGAAAAQAPAPGYGAAPVEFGRFDAQATGDVAAKLAICDATRFLRTDPDLEADKVLVRRDNGQLDLLLPPYFVDSFEWYDEDLERAYRRLRGQGAVSSDQVRAAKSAIGRDMVKTFDRVNGGERAFLRAQSRYCETVEDLGRS